MSCIRRATFVALLLLMVLTLPLQVAFAADDPALPAAGSGLFKFELTNLPSSSRFGEPGISVNKNGRIIVNTFGPSVWVSTDNGKIFSKALNLGPQDTTCAAGHGSSGDADAVVAFDNTFYVENLCLPTVGGAGNDVFANRQDAEPSAWSKPPTVAGGDVARGWIGPAQQTAAQVTLA